MQMHSADPWERPLSSKNRNAPVHARRSTIGAIIAAGLVLAAPAAAHAHVGVSPDAVEPGGSAVLTFSFSHGCDDSPTTALRFALPEGLASVAPTVDALWDIDVERAENGLVSAVTYSATDPVPNGLRGTATMSVRLADDAPEMLAFPVEQICADGSHIWDEVADPGTDPHDLESPAPTITVSSSEQDDADADAGVSEAGAPAPATAIALGLGGVGLIAGIAALIVSVRTARGARA